MLGNNGNGNGKSLQIEGIGAVDMSAVELAATMRLINDPQLLFKVGAYRPLTLKTELGTINLTVQEFAALLKLKKDTRILEQVNLEWDREFETAAGTAILNLPALASLLVILSDSEIMKEVDLGKPRRFSTRAGTTALPLPALANLMLLLQEPLDNALSSEYMRLEVDGRQTVKAEARDMATLLGIATPPPVGTRTIVKGKDLGATYDSDAKKIVFKMNGVVGQVSTVKPVASEMADFFRELAATLKVPEDEQARMFRYRAETPEVTPATTAAVSEEPLFMVDQEPEEPLAEEATPAQEPEDVAPEQAAVEINLPVEVTAD